MNITQEINKIEDQITLIEQRLTNVRKTVGGEILHEDVLVDYLNTPTYDNLHQYINNTCSAMRISGGVISDSGGGQIDVALGQGILKITDSSIGANTQFDWGAESNLVLTDNETNWVGIEYNDGIPKVKINTDLTNFNFNTDFILGRVYREGASLCILNAGSHYDNFQHRVCYRLFEVETFTRVSGGIVADAGNLDFSITEGAWYCGTTRFTTVVWDCSGADTFTYWYRDGGAGWTTAGAQADIDNLNYDDGDGVLGNLGVGRFGVHWVYLCGDGGIHIQYGQGNYKHFEADAAQVPVGPDFFLENCVLIGKIIVEQGSATLEDVISAFETVFIGASATVHNDLGGLQGGQADQYYHLNAAEHGYVSGVNAQDLLTTASPYFVQLGLLDTGSDHELYLKCNENLGADRILNIVVGDAARTITLSGNPTLADWFDQSVKMTVTPKFVSVQIIDTGLDHYLNIKVNENFTAHRTLNLITGDSSRTITLSGNPTLADWFDQSVKQAASPTFVDITAGHIGLGDAAVDPDFGISYEEVLIDTDNTAKIGSWIKLLVKKTAAVMTNIGIGVGGQCRLDAANTQNWTHATALRGLQGIVVTDAGSSGTVTGAVAFYTGSTIANAATVTNLYGLYISTPVVAGNKVINEYGIYIDDQNTGLTLNYAIYTNAGLVHFGDDVDVTGKVTTTSHIVTGTHYYMPNDSKMYGRNVGDTAYVKLVSINTSDHTLINADAGKDIIFQENSVAKMRLSGGVLDLLTNMPATTSKARAYLSADQLNITNITWTQVQINTENFDPGSDFNTGTYTYTAPVSGYYQLAGTVFWVGASVVANKQYWTGIFIDAAVVVASHVHAAYVAPVSSHVSTTYYVAAGQAIKLYCYHNAGVNTVDVDGDSTWKTFLSVHLLSSA